jgi:hypothetical protein
MKTLQLFVLFLAGAQSAVPQGTVRFDNNVPGVLVTHIYYSYDWRLKSGNGPNDTPSGSEDYRGMVLAEGAGFSAQLFAFPGLTDNQNSLEAALPVTTLGTGDQAGFLIPMIAELANVPPGSPVATLQLRAWDNRGGTLRDWWAAAAVAAPYGTSLMFTVNDIGGATRRPPELRSPPAHSRAVNNSPVGLGGGSIAVAAPQASDPEMTLAMGIIG